MPFLANAYALINTSIIEGFSNTFLEAFASGTPVITVSSVDPDNIIAKNKLGIVKKNHTELVDGINSLLMTKHYQDIVLRCRKYLTENHDPDILGKKFIAYLKEIV